MDWLKRYCKWDINISIFRQTGNFPMATGKPKTEIDIQYAIFASEGHAPPCVSVEYAHLVLGPLTKVCNHHVVTSRDGDALAEAMNIACSWGVPIESFHGGRFGQKVAAMRTNNFRVLIDNSPHEAERFREQITIQEGVWMIQFPDMHLFAPRVDHPCILRTAACDEAHALVQEGIEIVPEKALELLESAWEECGRILPQLHAQLCA